MTRGLYICDFLGCFVFLFWIKESVDSFILTLDNQLSIVICRAWSGTRCQGDLRWWRQILIHWFPVPVRWSRLWMTLDMWTTAPPVSVFDIDSTMSTSESIYAVTIGIQIFKLLCILNLKQKITSTLPRHLAFINYYLPAVVFFTVISYPGAIIINLLLLCIEICLFGYGVKECSQSLVQNILYLYTSDVFFCVFFSWIWWNILK